MTTLPPRHALAALVSNVTQSMLGVSFVRDAAREAPAGKQTSLAWLTAVLPICGARPLTVGLSSDQHGCSRLAEAMFACPPDQVDEAMMRDTLCELVNMTAGLLKSVLVIDQALGLPRVLAGAADVPDASPEVIVLKADDELGLVLWIYEGTA